MLRIHDVYKSFGQTSVLRGLSLDVNDGEFLSVVGRSGCGKTTLLRIVGGFEAADEGFVELGGKKIAAPGPDRVMVFQDFNQLFPWKTLLQNILYALKKTAPASDRKQAEALARGCIADVGLSGFEHSYPHQLSGGMKQRGALARALALRPAMLLMDEPFSSLDHFTRKSAQETIRQLWRNTGMTVLFVTHDIDEAVFLSDRIAVLGKRSGRIDAVFQNDGSAALRSAIEARLTADQESMR